MSNDPNLDRFIKFHRANPHIYQEFCRLTFELINNHGIKRCSHWLILNQIRWSHMIKTKSDEGFKISNNHFAYYARMFEHNNPHHEGFFKLKQMKKES